MGTRSEPCGGHAGLGYPVGKIPFVFVFFAGVLASCSSKQVGAIESRFIFKILQDRIELRGSVGRDFYCIPNRDLQVRPFNRTAIHVDHTDLVRKDFDLDQFLASEGGEASRVEFLSGDGFVTLEKSPDGGDYAVRLAKCTDVFGKARFQGYVAEVRY